MDRPTARPSEPGAHPPAIDAVCPYLLAADGGWRSASPAREHRCTAVAPAAPLAADKQRRLCLVAEHVGCATFRAATADLAGDDTIALRRGGRAPTRAYARTAPLVLDHGRMTFAIPIFAPERGVGQAGLVALLAIALVAIIVARIPAFGIGTTASDGGGPVASAAALPSATATPTPAATADARASDAPIRTLVPTAVEPTPAPSEPPAASPEPEASPSTYKVRRGDTLSGIAAEFGTTWQVLAELNGLDDPRRLRVGQVLVLP